MFATFENDTKVSKIITASGEGSVVPWLFVLQYWDSKREKPCAQEGTKERKLSSLIWTTKTFPTRVVVSQPIYHHLIQICQETFPSFYKIPLLWNSQDPLAVVSNYSDDSSNGSWYTLPTWPHQPCPKAPQEPPPSFTVSIRWVPASFH